MGFLGGVQNQKAQNNRGYKMQMQIVGCVLNPKTLMVELFLIYTIY